MSLLKVTDLSISFGDSRIVKDVSFEISDGERVCLIGESGSGKSLTATAINGLLPRNATVEGSILFKGQELIGMPEKHLRSIRGREIGFVFQEPQTALNPVIKIRQQLLTASRVHNQLGDGRSKQRAAELARSVNLPNPEEIIERYPHELSGGQRQRIIIAMAMSLSPALLIADEPTTALDATVQKHILELMDDATQRMNTALLMITHDMAVAYEIADRLLVMRHGSIVESGSSADVLTKPQHEYTKQLVDAARSTSLHVGERSGG